MHVYNKGFRKLLVWQNAHHFTVDIYRITKKFPFDETYGLISQLKRASSSIDAQIAEGSRMPTMNHRKLYYDRAYASAAEIDNFLELAHDLNYLSPEDYQVLLAKLNYISVLLHRLSASCMTKNR